MSYGPPGPGGPGGSAGPPMDAIDMFNDNSRSVDLEGLPLVMTIVVLVFMVLAIIAVGVRVVVRFSDGNFGLDDWLLVIGIVRIHSTVSLHYLQITNNL
jgi:hypothetical protein